MKNGRLQTTLKEPGAPGSKLSRQEPCVFGVGCFLILFQFIDNNVSQLYGLPFFPIDNITLLK
jgi:hypothetical protein